MANFDRAIPPGGEGEISAKINTRGMTGKIRKRMAVYTNDPAHSRETLTITASIKPFIDIVPDKLVYSLVGNPGETKSAAVMIKGREDRPLTLEEKYFDLTGIVEYSLEMVEENKLYKVSFQNIPGTSDNFKGHLKFKTNYPEKREISLNIRGRFVNRRK